MQSLNLSHQNNIKKLLDKIMQYHANHAKARVMVNLNSWGFSENDTLYMDWIG